MSYQSELQHLFSNNFTLIYQPIIDSTNDALWRMSNDNRDIDKVVIVVDEQSAGRGRRERNWVTPAGSAVLMSIGFRIDHRILKRLPIIIPVVVREVAQDYLLNKTLKIKWPNDIWHSDKKLAGILIDTRIKGRDMLAVIGMGINILHPNNDCGIGLLGAEQANRIDLIRASIAADLASRLASALYQEENPSEFVQQYNDYLLWRNMLIKERDGDTLGLCHGVNELGELLIERDGQITSYHQSELRIATVA